MPTSKLIHSTSTRRYLKLTEINKNVFDIENVFNIKYIYIFESY